MENNKTHIEDICIVESIRKSKDKIETIDDAKKAVAKAKEYGMMSLVILNEHGERERLVFRN